MDHVRVVGVRLINHVKKIIIIKKYMNVKYGLTKSVRIDLLRALKFDLGVLDFFMFAMFKGWG